MADQNRDKVTKLISSFRSLYTAVFFLVAGYLVGSAAAATEAAAEVEDKRGKVTRAWRKIAKILALFEKKLADLWVATVSIVAQ